MNIEITRLKNGLHLNIAPPYLIKYLKYFHRSMELVNYKRKPIFTEKLIHIPDGNGGIFTLQGFFTSICEMIHREKDTFVVKDQRPKLPEVDWDAVKRLGPKDYQIEPLAEFLTTGVQNSGAIVAAGGWGKTYAQAFTYAAFNKLNTILAIPLKQVFVQTYAKFCALFPDKHIGRVGDGYLDISKDITITTFKSLKKCAIEKCELLLVDELQCSTGEQIQDVLTSISPIRIFGYTATDNGLFNGADKLLKGIYGERLINIPYQEAQEAGAVVPGIVYFIRMPTENAMITASSMDQVMVQGIKKNKTRNSLIAKVCAAVPNKWATLVFVDHIKDHLAKLYELMPSGTKYIHREGDKKKAYGLTKKQQDEIVSQFSNNEFQYLIATDAFRAGVDIPHLRVVVQAAGGSSKIEVIQEALRGSRVLSEERQKELKVEKKTHFVLIDFLDNHDERLHAMALKRKKHYEAEGWDVREVTEISEIDWFDYEKKIIEL